MQDETKYNTMLSLDCLKIFPKNLLAIILPLLLISCSESEDTQRNHQVEVQLSEVLSIGEDNLDDGNIYAFHIDRENNVYISDQTDETVLRKYALNISELSNS